MSIGFKALAPERLEELRRFLLGVFRLPDNAQFVRRDLMAWKYFAPHPFWTGPRSYVLDRDGEIAAHGCVSPVRYSTPSGEVSSMQIIDWAANGLVPGGGVLVYRNCLAMADTLLAIGGSADTQRLIPTLKWFRRLPDLQSYARPLRPWKQFLRTPVKDWKSPARLARNTLWSMRRLPATATEYSSPRSALWFTPELRDYLLACPAARMEAFQDQVLLAYLGPQVRIVDSCSRPGAIAAAVRHAAQNPDVCEIAAESSLPEVQQALRRCGFHLRESVPVYLADPRKRFPSDLPIEVNLSIGDGFYLTDKSRPFWT